MVVMKLVLCLLVLLPLIQSYPDMCYDKYPNKTYPGLQMVYINSVKGCSGYCYENSYNPQGCLISVVSDGKCFFRNNMEPFNSSLLQNSLSSDLYVIKQECQGANCWVKKDNQYFSKARDLGNMDEADCRMASAEKFGSFKYVRKEGRCFVEDPLYGKISITGPYFAMYGRCKGMTCWWSEFEKRAVGLEGKVEKASAAECRVYCWRRNCKIYSYSSLTTECLFGQGSYTLVDDKTSIVYKLDDSCV